MVTDRDALSVGISVKRRILFQLRYGFSQIEKRIDIGTYPLLSLKDARNLVHQFKLNWIRGEIHNN